jgi:hypothetical protein
MSMTMTLKRHPATKAEVKELGLDVEFERLPATRGARDEGRLLEPDEGPGIVINSITLFGVDITDDLPVSIIYQIEDYLIGWK